VHVSGCSIRGGQLVLYRWPFISACFTDSSFVDCACHVTAQLPAICLVPHITKGPSNHVYVLQRIKQAIYRHGPYVRMSLPTSAVPFSVLLKSCEDSAMALD